MAATETFYGSDLLRASDGMPAFGATQASTLAADTSSTATTVVDPGPSVTLAPNATYYIDAIVIFQTAAMTTGLKFGFAFSHIAAGALFVRIPVSASASASALEQAFATTGNFTSTGVSAANTNHYARVSGTITTDGTGGAFALRYASGVSGSAATLKAGSILTATRLA